MQILTLLTTDQLVMWPDRLIEAPMHILFHGVDLSLLESLRNGERALWSDGFIRSMILGTSWAVETEEATGESNITVLGAHPRDGSTLDRHG